jgi:hypothetical protein
MNLLVGESAEKLRGEDFPEDLIASVHKTYVHDALSVLLTRHCSGDWGNVCKEDRQANDDALNSGERLLSSYEVFGVKVWIITEWDRSYTTILMPSEY